MSRIPIIFILLINLCIGQAQSIKDLYTQRNYKELIKFEDKSDLTELECYFVGFAFFQLENDEKAIKMYDKAISLGLDDAHIYLYKGLAITTIQYFIVTIIAVMGYKSWVKIYKERIPA